MRSTGTGPRWSEVGGAAAEVPHAGGKEALGEVQRLFVNNSIDQVMAYNSKLKSEIEQSNEDLRDVVGKRYRDLITACDEVIGMDKVCQQIIKLRSTLHRATTKGSPRGASSAQLVPADGTAAVEAAASPIGMTENGKRPKDAFECVQNRLRLNLLSTQQQLSALEGLVSTGAVFEAAVLYRQLHLRVTELVDLVTREEIKLGEARDAHSSSQSPPLHPRSTDLISASLRREHTSGSHVDEHRSCFLRSERKQATGLLVFLEQYSRKIHHSLERLVLDAAAQHVHACHARVPASAREGTAPESAVAADEGRSNGPDTPVFAALSTYTQVHEALSLMHFLSNEQPLVKFLDLHVALLKELPHRILAHPLLQQKASGTRGSVLAGDMAATTAGSPDSCKATAAAALSVVVGGALRGDSEVGLAPTAGAPGAMPLAVQCIEVSQALLLQLVAYLEGLGVLLKRYADPAAAQHPANASFAMKWADAIHTALEKNLGLIQRANDSATALTNLDGTLQQQSVLPTAAVDSVRTESIGPSGTSAVVDVRGGRLLPLANKAFLDSLTYRICGERELDAGITRGALPSLASNGPSGKGKANMLRLIINGGSTDTPLEFIQSLAAHCRSFTQNVGKFIQALCGAVNHDARVIGELETNLLVQLREALGEQMVPRDGTGAIRLDSSFNTEFDPVSWHDFACRCVASAITGTAKVALEAAGVLIQQALDRAVEFGRVPLTDEPPAASPRDLGSDPLLAATAPVHSNSVTDGVYGVSPAGAAGKVALAESHSVLRLISYLARGESVAVERSKGGSAQNCADEIIAVVRQRKSQGWFSGTGAAATSPVATTAAAAPAEHLRAAAAVDSEVEKLNAAIVQLTRVSQVASQSTSGSDEAHRMFMTWLERIAADLRSCVDAQLGDLQRNMALFSAPNGQHPQSPLSDWKAAAVANRTLWRCSLIADRLLCLITPLGHGGTASHRADGPHNALCRSLTDTFVLCHSPWLEAMSRAWGAALHCSYDDVIRLCGGGEGEVAKAERYLAASSAVRLVNGEAFRVYFGDQWVPLGGASAGWAATVEGDGGETPTVFVPRGCSAAMAELVFAAQSRLFELSVMGTLRAPLQDCLHVSLLAETLSVAELVLQARDKDAVPTGASSSSVPEEFYLQVLCDVMYMFAVCEPIFARESQVSLKPSHDRAASSPNRMARWNTVAEYLCQCTSGMSLGSNELMAGATPSPALDTPLLRCAAGGSRCGDPASLMALWKQGSCVLRRLSEDHVDVITWSLIESTVYAKVSEAALVSSNALGLRMSMRLRAPQNSTQRGVAAAAASSTFVAAEVERFPLLPIAVPNMPASVGPPAQGDRAGGGRADLSSAAVPRFAPPSFFSVAPPGSAAGPSHTSPQAASPQQVSSPAAAASNLWNKGISSWWQA